MLSNATLIKRIPKITILKTIMINYLSAPRNRISFNLCVHTTCIYHEISLPVNYCYFNITQTPSEFVLAAVVFCPVGAPEKNGFIV